MYYIDRDSYYPIACIMDNYDELTNAGWKGLDCSIESCENKFNLEINYYVKVNFTSFLIIIDLLGTIVVYKLFSFTSCFSFKKGMNSINEKKLVFSLERKVFALRDVQHGLKQQEVIKAFFKRILIIRDKKL